MCPLRQLISKKDNVIMNSDSVFTTAMQQGAFNDLTSFLSGDGLKEFPNLARIAPSVWQNSRFQGKILGVPRSRTELGDVMMYRKDWADKLGLGIPQNPNEYMQMLMAFTKGDPTGTGRKVWGFGGRAMFGMNHYITNIFGVPVLTRSYAADGNGRYTRSELGFGLTNPGSAADLATDAIEQWFPTYCKGAGSVKRPDNADSTVEGTRGSKNQAGTGRGLSQGTWLKIA